MKIGPDRQTFWDWRAAMNFMLGGAGSGLILTAAVAMASGSPARFPILLGAAMVAVGLVCVWFEIGRPERFINVLRNPFTSWMSREAWAAIVLLPLAVAVFAFGLPVPAMLLALAAFGFLFCQARILSASLGIPSWRLTGTCRLIVATGLAEGVALYLVLSPMVVRGGFEWATFVLIAALVLIVARAICWWRWRSTLGRRGPRASFHAVRRIDNVFMAAGHLVPLLLIPAAWALPKLAAPLILAAGILTLAAGWILKYQLITRGAHTQGFALENTPARGGGRAGPGIRPEWN